MPKQLSSTIMFTVFLVAIVVAANRAEQGDLGRGAGTRGPASVNGQIALAADVKPALFRHTEKLHGPVTVNLDLVGAEPAAAGDVFVLKGVIRSSQRLENVEYHWSLPATIELINGSLKGTIDTIAADGNVDVELTLRTRTAANAQIHLLATAHAHRARFAESAQYNTVLQHAYRESRERLMKSTEAAGAPGATDLKVFH